jgi:lipopolysaccharide transport system permease protein
MSVEQIKSTQSFFPNLREAWHHRHLAFMLAQRNIKSRYMQTLLGSAWIILQPLLLTGMLTLILGLLLAAPSDKIPYSLFAFTGTTVWSAFQRVFTDTSMSLAGSGSIILKVYFPRILVPLSAALAAMFDIIPVYVLLVIVVALYGHIAVWLILLSPAILLLTFVLSFSLGIWVTVLDAVFRDMRLIVPSALQLLFFATPVMYSEQVVPERWLVLYRLNPLACLIKAFRWATVEGAVPPSVLEIGWTCGVTLLAALCGLMLFARLENFAVDRI